MSGKTGRNRPRKRSLGYFNLEWVLVRVVALQVMMPFDDGSTAHAALSKLLCEQDTADIRRATLRLLRLNPWRNEYPQPLLFAPAEWHAAEHFNPRPATTEPPPIPGQAGPFRLA
jgi:hypothetical protein